MHRCVRIFWTWMLRLDVNLDWDGTNMYRSGLFGLKQLCDMKQLLLYSVCGYQFLIIDPHKLADSFNVSENKCYDFFCRHKLADPIPHALMTHIWQNENDLHPPNIISQQKYHWPNKMNTNKIAPSMFHQLAFATRWTEFNSNTKRKSNWWWNDISKKLIKKRNKK